MSRSSESEVLASLGPTSAAEAEQLAERLRADLADTLDRLGDNLVPTRLASEAVAAARASTPDWLKRYWAFAQSPNGLAIIGGVAALGLAGGVAGGAAVKRRRPVRRR